jgi:MacB-like periplasmic core domain
VYEASPGQRERFSLIAPVRLDDWNRLNRTLTAISGSDAENVTDTSGAEPERLDGRRVLPRFFEVFGMTALAGRTFTADEERFGGSTAVVISDVLWARRFGRSPAAIDARLTIAGIGYTVVGVMPRAFTPGSIDVWVPAQVAPGLMRVREALHRRRRAAAGNRRRRRGCAHEGHGSGSGAGDLPSVAASLASGISRHLPPRGARRGGPTESGRVFDVFAASLDPCVPCSPWLIGFICASP